MNNFISKFYYYIAILLIIINSNSLYPQYELGLNYNAGLFYPNKFINSLYHTYFTYYQFNKVHIIKKEDLNYNQNIEIFFLVDSILDNHSFIKLGFGNYLIGSIYSYYFSENNQYKLKWKGEFNNIFFDFGQRFFINRKIGWEIYGGIGYIPDFRLYYKQWETNQKLFKEPFEYSSGKFSSSEGMLFRLGINLLYKINPIIIRMGMNYQYILSSLFQSNDESFRWFWINQSKIWITKDITEYIKNKEQYEQENKNIIQQFPTIEMVKPNLSTLQIFIGIGYNF